MNTIGSTPNCKNTFLEEDGFCTACGRNHFKEQPTRGKAALPATRQETTKVILAEAINREIEATPEYREARKMIQRIAADLVEAPVRVVFRNRQGSYHQWQEKTQEHLIVLGYQSIDRSAKKGWHEYKSLEHLVPSPRPTGVKAAQWLAVHEVAHAIDRQENGRRYGVCHGYSFYKIYKALIDLYLK